ncbi:hypothetical protein [Clostridium sp. MD294]|uniref:hypothetical protein n=1 Tax=Clostridium sp. MD294 TaxID=97138 RepID=UPI0002CC768F|nr:hypothetical protein [Clostridium sp. MD294]USF31187.1 hypothetical protein C820_002633 [Clostridium sp. MD294]
MSEECKKYELLPSPITVNGCTAYKIKALQSFGNVVKGQTGGAVSSEANLSHLGCCWIYDSAAAVGNAKVYGNAKIYDNAVIAENAEIYDCAKIGGNSVVKGNAQVYDCARVLENAVIDGNSKIRGLMRVYGDSKVNEENWE